MREVLGDIRRWRGDGQRVALATVVQTWGSSPRRPGAKMAISAAGQLSGSVSGGCVEGAVAEEAFGVLESGAPKLLHYGIADETGWEVGLACGGNIQIFVEALDNELFAAIHEIMAAERAGAVATVIAGPDALLGRKLVVDHDRQHWLGGINATLDATVAQLARTTLAHGSSERVVLPDDGVELFVDLLLPPPTLVMVGGVHIAITLEAFSKTLNYLTIVIDPRHAFGSDERFPDVDQLLQSWPDEAFAQLKLNESVAVAILTHDPKIDDPALQSVLRSPVFYIGALGSRKTHSTRIERLRGEGFTQQEIERIHSPIGLQIDAQIPEEIALAIMAQIVKMRHATR